MKKEMSYEQLFQKLQSTTVPNKNCPIRRTLDLFNGKWRTYVLFELCKYPSRRFGELKKAIPLVTNTMLTMTLRDLENTGIVNRQQFNEIPPHVEYSLSESGKELLPIFFEIAKWSEAHIPDEVTDERT
jgi:DNA-binding HxlR family transcriptional regulator